MRRVLDGLYVLAILIAGPIYLVVRRIQGKPLAPLRPRLGAVTPPRPGPGPVVWIHAVSVGEAKAVRAYVNALKLARPDVRIVLTCTTHQGLATARRDFSDVDVRESPLDFSFVVDRFFDRLSPRALVLVEAELWPNLLWTARRRGVPVHVVNARVSDRSLGRWRVVTRLFPSFLDAVAVWMAQSEDQVPRLESLGISRERIVVAGNLKFDAARAQDRIPVRAEVRTRLGWADTEAVFIAGSTHPGEHEQIIAAFAEARLGFPQARLIIAPRHLERVADVDAILQAHGIRSVHWSVAEGGNAVAVVVDTTGELARMYGAADLAFVGGTLVPGIGGHNVLEPAAFAIPIVVGPHLASGVRGLAAPFIAERALAVVNGVPELVSRLRETFADPIGTVKLGAPAQRLLLMSGGAAARGVERLVSGL